jgi:hypothetical protein
MHGPTNPKCKKNNFKKMVYNQNSRSSDKYNDNDCCKNVRNATGNKRKMQLNKMLSL